MEYALEMKDICKVYPNGVYANKNVNFSVYKGEIHALVGENGAGKSTLMKILFGLEQPDSGDIYIEGKPEKLTSPSVAIRHGIGMVHQHFMLVDSLTVAENTALGSETVKGIFVDSESINKKVAEISELYKLNLDPKKRLGDLSVGSKQRVEILKTLYRGARIIVLDEPTAVLTPQETKELFERLVLLKAEGYTIIFISHKLDEIKQITDRITILRRGKTIETVHTADVNEQEISNLMIGDEVQLLSAKSEPKPTETVLELKDVCYSLPTGLQVLKNINMRIRSGEIIGLAGIEGNGQSELVDIITGQLKYQGMVNFNGQKLQTGKIAYERDRGICYIPADRMTRGGVLDMSIEENMIATEVRKSKFTDKIPFIISRKKTREFSEKLIKEHDVRTESPDTPLKMLSGGNMQKVIVAREFASESNFVVADQPTRGIDILAADSIRRMLVKKREEGSAVLLISADLQELISVSDSILVIYHGEIAAYFPHASEVTQTELGNYMLGAKRMSPEQIEEGTA